MHISEVRRRITHCPHGHRYDEANTYRRADRSSRDCRSCMQIRSKAQRRKQPEEVAQQSLRWRQNNPGEVRARNWRQMLKQYGLTPASYGVLLGKQEGLCAICAKPCKSGRRLAVDHDHASDRVRGLLCMNCNRGLGQFGDDEVRLAAASNYLALSRMNTSLSERGDAIRI